MNAWPGWLIALACLAVIVVSVLPSLLLHVGGDWWATRRAQRAWDWGEAERRRRWAEEDRRGRCQVNALQGYNQACRWTTTLGVTLTLQQPNR
jgi:hypothetical protein